MRNIVCISATSRPGNYTARALALIVDELKKAGEQVRVFDARDLALAFPGHPATPDALELQAAVGDASGVVVASPEYHGSVPAMAKLIIENLGFPSRLAGKPVALAGLAAGRIGAIKSLEQMKGICSHVGAVVVPGAVSIAGVQQVFDDQGNCLDEGSGLALRGVAHALRKFLNDFVCPRFALEEMVRQGGRPWAAGV